MWYSSPVAENRSRLRQQIGALEGQRDQQLDLVLGERGPLLRGNVAERSRVCGHPTCHCATQGELHVSPYLSVTVGGSTRQTHLPAGDVQQVRERTERYRRVRQARARLAQLAAEQIKLVDRLTNALLGAYPADRPLEPAGRRGPRPKKARHGTP